MTTALPTEVQFLFPWVDSPAQELDDPDRVPELEVRALVHPVVPGRQCMGGDPGFPDEGGEIELLSVTRVGAPREDHLWFIPMELIERLKEEALRRHDEEH